MLHSPLISLVSNCLPSFYSTFAALSKSVSGRHFTHIIDTNLLLTVTSTLSGCRPNRRHQDEHNLFFSSSTWIGRTRMEGLRTSPLSPWTIYAISHWKWMSRLPKSLHIKTTITKLLIYGFLLPIVDMPYLFAKMFGITNQHQQ